MPPQSISKEILLEKYANGYEQNVDAVRRRVARALAAWLYRNPKRSGWF